MSEAKKQKMTDIKAEAISQFNLLTDIKKGKQEPQEVWDRYVAVRRRCESKAHEAQGEGSCDSGDDDEEEDDLCDDPTGFAYRQLLRDFKSSDDIPDSLKKHVYFDVSGANWEDEDTIRGVDVTTTIFSPKAAARAIRCTMTFHFRPRSSWVEYTHAIDLQFLSFDGKDTKKQRLASHQLDPQRLDVKKLTVAKVKQICKHLKMDETDRLAIMKALLAPSLHFDDCGGYHIPDRAGLKASGLSDSNVPYQMNWLEYNMLTACEKVEPYFRFFSLEKRE